MMLDLLCAILAALLVVELGAAALRHHGRAEVERRAMHQAQRQRLRERRASDR